MQFRLVPVLLEFPLSIVERTDLPCFQPSRDAVKVEGMVAHAPRYCALFTGRWRLVCLTFNAKVHNVITANSAVVDNNVCNRRNWLAYLKGEINRKSRQMRKISVHCGTANDNYAIAPYFALRSRLCLCRNYGSHCNDNTHPKPTKQRHSTENGKKIHIIRNKRRKSRVHFADSLFSPRSVSFHPCCWMKAPRTLRHRLPFLFWSCFTRTWRFYRIIFQAYINKNKQVWLKPRSQVWLESEENCRNLHKRHKGFDRQRTTFDSS